MRLLDKENALSADEYRKINSNPEAKQKLYIVLIITWLLANFTPSPWFKKKKKEKVLILLLFFFFYYPQAFVQACSANTAAEHYWHTFRIIPVQVLMLPNVSLSITLGNTVLKMHFITLAVIQY